VTDVTITAPETPAAPPPPAPDQRQHGLSQVQFAARLGISQGQCANAIRGHDPISSFAVNRARGAVL
jgi:hypothetical protein